MPSFESFLIARVGKKMAKRSDNDEHGNLTPSPSTNFIQSQSPVSIVPTDSGGVATMSAFEITSVSSTLEAEEAEGIMLSTSRDAEEMKAALGRENTETNRLSSSSGDSESNSVTIAGTQNIVNNIDHMTGEPLSGIPSNPSPKPQDGNGPLAVGGQSRFRRVNVYVRGRWFVRDTHEPEERPESEFKIPTPSDLPSGSSPSQGRKHPGPSTLTTSEYSYDSKLHSRSNSEASFIHIEQHAPFLSREPGTLSDRSSVHADTNPSLSRTESISSLVTKSLDDDGETRARDIDVESVASIPNTHTPDLQSVSSTYNSIEKPPQKLCDICSRRNIQDLPLEDQYHAVEATVVLLKEQLSQLLQHNNSPYQSLLREKDELLKENTRLKERVRELEAVNNGTDRAGVKGELVTNYSSPH